MNAESPKEQSNSETESAFSILMKNIEEAKAQNKTAIGYRFDAHESDDGLIAADKLRSMGYRVHTEIRENSSWPNSLFLIILWENKK